mgnify:CR=1 FL=1
MYYNFIVGVYMKKNKNILKYCPNFYKIINFEIIEGDYITNKLIQIYQDYIFNEENDLEDVTKLDFALNKYLEDYYFRKEMRRGLMEIRVKKDHDIIKSIVSSIINLSENYEMGYTRNIYFARWI